MSEAVRLAEEAVALLNQRCFAEASNLYQRSLLADPSREDTWMGLALALTLAGQLKDVALLADMRQQSRADGFLFFYRNLLVLMTYGLHDHVLALQGALPVDSGYAPALAYQSGCVHLLRGDEGAAFACFGAFKRGIAGRGDLPIGPESEFNIAYRQGTLIEDTGYVADLAHSAATIPSALDFSNPLLRCGGTHVLAAACDARYFERYAGAWIGSIAKQDPHATLHLHIAEPDAETLALADALSRQHAGSALNFSTEQSSGGGAYFAAMRFLIAPALLERYRQPVFLSDIDVIFQRSLQELDRSLAHSDFACFRHDGAGPCSRYPAVLTRFGDSAGGREVLRLTGAFIRSKLTIPWPFNWMLDQAALGSVKHYLAEKRPDIVVAVINDRNGRDYRDWLHPIADDAKEKMIRASERRHAPE